MKTSSPQLYKSLTAISWFTSDCGGVTLRPYQMEVAQVVTGSVLNGLGRSFVVIFPRQSGKNEVQAQVQAYLLYMLSAQDVEMVSVSPTFRPQTLNAIARLERALERNTLTRGRWKKEAGFTLRLGRASIRFFSGSPRAHTVGATASALLSVDEAQDVLKNTFDHKFAPMAASTNATRVFWGTAWTSQTLLSRERKLAEQVQEADGMQRLWVLHADEVQACHPPYGEYVKEQVRRLGRENPLIRTQYFSEEIDAQVGMFNPGRMMLMNADQPEQQDPPIPYRWDEWEKLSEEEKEKRRHLPFAFLIDAAGQDESRMELRDEAPLENPGRDSVSLSICTVDTDHMDLTHKPTYRIVKRVQWTGENHLAVFGKLQSLVDAWEPEKIAMDVTGVGEGLWAMLDKWYHRKLVPVKFSTEEKSEIGWRFLSIIETGRFKDCAPREAVKLQYEQCRSEILPGPRRTLRWGVPENARGPDGELVHDDFLMADALVAALDRLEWTVHFPTIIIPGPDPFKKEKW